MSSERRDRVRVEIEQLMGDMLWGWDMCSEGTATPCTSSEMSKSYAEKILAIPNLAVVDREAEGPIYWREVKMPFRLRDYIKEEGWVKEEKDV